MATADGSLSGRCLCGAVSFTFKPDKNEVSACHCSKCRRWTSSPFLVIDHDGPVAFEGAENIGVYKSSDWGERAFCKSCGSILYWRMSGVEHFAVSAGALDDQSALTFTSEIFIDDKPGYYAFANDTHKMTGEEVVAAFAAGKEPEQG